MGGLNFDAIDSQFYKVLINAGNFNDSVKFLNVDVAYTTGIRLYAGLHDVTIRVAGHVDRVISIAEPAEDFVDSTNLQDRDPIDPRAVAAHEPDLSVEREHDVDVEREIVGVRQSDPVPSRSEPEVLSR
jgi:hypothetical protein